MRAIVVSAALPLRAWPFATRFFLLLAATFALYLVELDKPTNDDEIYHIVAASELLATGEPRFADGEYRRALAFTWIVAVSFRLFGESVEAARLPSVLFAVLTVALLFAWLRARADETAAWVVGLLYATSPFAVQIAQFCRFYALQALLVLLLAVILDAALDRRRQPGTRLALAALLLPPAGLALHLQPTTLFALAGLGLWGGVRLAAEVRSCVSRAMFRALIGLAAAVALAVGLLAYRSGSLAELLADYRWTPLFNEENRDNFLFYHVWYLTYYPTLWTLTPLLALFALARAAPVAFLALAVFTTGFVLNSFAGPKSLRYIAYAQPFLFVLWGLALPQLAALAREPLARLRDLLAGTEGLRALPAGLVRRLPALAIAAIVFVNPAWLRTATFLLDIPLPGEQPPILWRQAATVLAPPVAGSEIVVATDERPALYYLGRFDLVLNRSRLSELPQEQQREFGIDPRTGRPVIAQAASLHRLIACHRTGLVVGPAVDWRRPHVLSEEVVRLLETELQEVALPPASRVRAFLWRRDSADPTACPEWQERRSGAAP